MNVRNLLKAGANMLSEHSPAILTGLGIVGFVTTVAMTAKAASKVEEIHISAEADRDSCETKEELRDSYVEEAKALAPLVVPVAAVGVTSIGCFIFANKVQADRRAAVMAAYSLSAETLSRYQDKVIEKLGEDEHRNILHEATKDLVSENVPVGYNANAEVIPMGKVRVFDTVTGRYFFSTKEDIYAAESEINQMLVDQVRVEHQEFYYLLGLEESYSLGRSMGWDVSSSFGGRAMKIWLSPHLDDEKNPCLAMSYHVVIFDRAA